MVYTVKDWKRVVFIRVGGKYCELKYDNEKKELIRTSLKALEKDIVEKGFIRVNRWYAVNYEYISKISNVVYLSDGTKIKVARGQIKRVKREYEHFLVNNI